METPQASRRGTQHLQAALRAFYKGRTKLYGAYVKGGGARYGPEVNGVQSKWGTEQNIDFTLTPGFLALSSPLPVKQAIKSTLDNYGTTISKLASRIRANGNRSAARQNLQTLKSIYPKISHQQMAFWMQELSEIAVLDYVFSQQDRIGNIDYKWYWYYTDSSGKVRKVREESEVPRGRMSRLKPPGEIADQRPILIQRTQLNDNDAGGRVAYANYAKKARMLEKIRHLNGDFYGKLKQLESDFNSKSTLYRYIVDNFPLSDRRQIPQIQKNLSLAMGILRKSCQAGKIKFDLDSKKFFKNGDVGESNPGC